MTNSYTTGRSAQRWRQLALAALLATGATAAQAQTLNYGLGGAQNLAGTYTDLGTTGTVIATPNNDDANSAATPIGFSFSFNGTAFTDFVLNTNGYLKLGTVAPVAPYFSAGPQDFTAGPIQAAGQNNLLLPFNVDLTDATAAPAEFRTITTGTAPNRVCTIQWKNVKDKANTIGTQYDAFAFQVKLYETTNRVEFVYNTGAAGAGPDAFKYVNVGIKGSGSGAGQLVLWTKGSTGAWSTATPLAGDYTTGVGNAHNIRSTVRPDAGRTYRFSPAANNDAAVQAIYTLGKLPIPIAVPHTIQAVIRNVGLNALTNVGVTATTPAPNAYSSTKTIASLAVGASATVTFDPYTPTTATSQAVTVTLAGDDNTLNNVSTYQQLVNTTTFAYAQPGVAPASATSGIGFNTGSGILAVRYNTNAPRTATGVTVRLEDANSVGRTVYGVVTDAAGTIIGQSANYVVTTADLNTDHVFNFTTPAAIAAGDFYVGLAQTANATGYFPVGYQTENPSRPLATYSIPLAGGAPVDQVAGNLGTLMIEAITAAPASCTPPTAVTVTGTTANSATITFTGPSNATNYTVIYGATGFNPATGGTSVTATSSPFTITGLNSSTTYQFYIRTNCVAPDQSTLVGPFSFSTSCVAPIITAFPYTESFDGVAAGALPCGITVLDVNNDAKTWQVVASNPASGANSMRYSYNAASAADDWFFTPALFLRAGSRYQLQFKYRAFGFPEKLEVKHGATATPAGMTTTIFQNANITSSTYATTVAGTGAGQVNAITPTANGNVFIGFHAYSDADQFNLYVDDISIAQVTGTSAALDRAISVFPNPSTGVVTLEIRGANAKGAMQVEVINALGQRVHSEMVSDNAPNKMDLSNLAAGLYTLKVKSGNDFSIRQLVIQK
ncbi:T9SS-dependent choice-of-anchor J family protein [Hymenobacter persicinus]|uniref:T9SS type A sorting domain-containing protein n=1 Tax=Hymenobacter persicinus TaxID=2025506 RepID=A0A4Q5LEP3_9BACT|nr:choice-of-anchor J domain-containing protein [Hymenobacter persicinus]RYU80790.1 T9SS type A sorting domain-containing protein [Hymenobacter persicinus]